MKSSGEQYTAELTARVEAAEAAAATAKADADSAASSASSAAAELEAKVAKLQAENKELDGAVEAARARRCRLVQARRRRQAHVRENSEKAVAMREKEAAGRVVERRKVDVGGEGEGCRGELEAVAAERKAAAAAAEAASALGDAGAAADEIRRFIRHGRARVPGGVRAAAGAGGGG